jgi:hypothetical protein
MIDMPNILWKTPEEVDADRLAEDYRRIDNGDIVAHSYCALAYGPAADRGHKVVPPPLEDEEQA